MNVFLRDPYNFVAKTFDEAVLKLEKLIEMSNGADQWGENILESAKDLLPEYEEKFIMYLANPSGCKTNFTMNRNISKKDFEKLKIANPEVDFDQKQRTTVVKTRGNTQYLMVEGIEDSEDEKLP